MVILVVSSAGFVELGELIHSGAYPVWLNVAVAADETISVLRRSGIDVTVFHHEIDSSVEQELLDALRIVSEHHPGERIWCEFGTGRQ